MTPEQKTEYMARVAARLADPATAANAKRRADRIGAGLPDAAIDAIARQMQSEKTVARRILWLHHASDLLAAAAAPVAPCKSGCSHCCHMATIITSHEAERIAKASGRPMATPPDTTFSDKAAEADKFDRIKYKGVPCPFLINNNCSVYEARPFACRKHYVVDSDNLLCKIIPGEEIIAPHYNANLLDTLFLFAHIKPSNLHMADIRDFFPDDAGT